jgi:CheY-like chemotaxis protein
MAPPQTLNRGVLIRLQQQPQMTQIKQSRYAACRAVLKDLAAFSLCGEVRKKAMPQAEAEERREDSVEGLSAAAAVARLGDSGLRAPLLMWEISMSKILVVEDSPEFGEMLATVLQAEGHTVMTAEDGLHAIGKMEFWHPDLIITDIHMPALNGLEMIRRIRLDTKFSTVPIIGLSAYPRRGLDLAIKAGASVSLSKPVGIRCLIDHVAHLLRSGSAEAGSESQLESSGY